MWRRAETARFGDALAGAWLRASMVRLRAAVASLLAAATSVVAQAPATAVPSAEEFYQGRAITLVISFGPGGLNDIAGRLVAQHLPRFLSGNPRVVVQNMPGAGGLTAANHLYHTVPADGSVIAQLDRNVAQSGIRGAANARFDPLQFTWLGSLSNYENEAYLLWVKSSHPARAVADLARLDAPVRVGAVSGGTNMLMSLVARDVLGLKLNVVRGYVSGPAIWLAMDRGEVDGQTIGFTSVMAEHPEKWERGEIRPLLQLGRASRLPAFADVPTGRELAATADARALVEFAELPFLTSLPYVAPPGVPVDRARALELAFERMTRDEAFIADAKRRRVELSPVTGSEILHTLRRSAATPRELIARFNAVLEQR